jgi:hypothetical protein
MKKEIITIILLLCIPCIYILKTASLQVSHINIKYEIKYYVEFNKTINPNINSNDFYVLYDEMIGDINKKYYMNPIIWNASQIIKNQTLYQKIIVFNENFRENEKIQLKKEIENKKNTINERWKENIVE